MRSVITIECEIVRIGRSLVWFAADKAGLLGALSPAEEFVRGNLRTWEQHDRPVRMEIRNGNDTYCFSRSSIAPGGGTTL